MSETGCAATAVGDDQLARSVAEHKSRFFVEKDANGSKVDYLKAVTGGLQLVPTGAALSALQSDYTEMLEDGLLALNQLPFDEMMKKCMAIEDEVNQRARDRQESL